MKKFRNGFTLIEILIVISILLALTFVGVLHYSNVLEENNTKIDVLNAKTIAEGIKIAGVSGAIDMNKDATDQPLTADIKKFIDGDFVPLSKTYGASTEGASFTYNIKDRLISVNANGKQVYPQAK